MGDERRDDEKQRAPHNWDRRLNQQYVDEQRGAKDNGDVPERNNIEHRPRSQPLPRNRLPPTQDEPRGKQVDGAERDYREEDVESWFKCGHPGEPSALLTSLCR